MPCPNSQSSIYQGLKSAWYKFSDVQPENPPTDPDCLLWYERVKCSRFDLLLPFVQALFVLLDVGFDLQVAVKHFQLGDYNWAVYTVTIVFVSLIFVQVVSVFFFIEDKNDQTDKQDALLENGVTVKWWMLISHLFLVGRLVRFYQIWKVARIIRKERDNGLEKSKKARERFVRRHMLYILQTADSNNLGLIEGFLENAPQVMLQFYILLGQTCVDLTSRDDLLVTLNIVKSLLLFAFSHLSYTRGLRKQDPESGQLEWFSKGAVSLYFWRLFMLVSRILVLALFASTFEGYFTALLIAVHFVVFLIIVAKQQCDYFDDNRKMQHLFKLAVAYIHIFSFFPLIPRETQNLGVKYYGITFVENSAILVLWFFFSSWGLAFKIGAVVVEKISFSVGLACLVLYYRYFHPSIAQNAGEENNVQNIEDEDGAKKQTKESGSDQYMYETNV